MKQALLIVFLGLGLVSLAACTTGRQNKTNEEVNPINAGVVPNVQEEVAVEATPLNDGPYALDLEASKVIWRGEKTVIGKAHVGTVNLKSGSLQILAGKLAGGEFVIDMNTLKNDEGLDGLNKHLMSADFFDVATYPESKLVITGVEAGTEADTYQVEADLTIKDQTAPVNFVAKMSADNTTIKAITAFEIDRTNWGLKYGSGKFFQDLGDNLIGDEIQFNIDFQAKR